MLPSRRLPMSAAIPMAKREPVLLLVATNLVARHLNGSSKELLKGEVIGQSHDYRANDGWHESNKGSRARAPEVLGGRPWESAAASERPAVS